MSTKLLKDVVFKEGEKHFLSLVKLIGSPVKDIEITISEEFGSPCIQLFRVVLEDGRQAFVEAEHDIAYLGKNLGVSEEQLSALRLEQDATP